MGSFNKTALNPQFYTGNAVILLIGTQEIGFGQSTTYNIGFGAEQFYEIGTAKPAEIQQLRYAPSVTIDSFLLSGAGLTAFGYSGNTPLRHVLANNKFNIYLNDYNLNTVFVFSQCTAGSINITAPANAQVTEAIEFLALDVLNSQGQSILTGNFALTTSSAQIGTVVGSVA